MKIITDNAAFIQKNDIYYLVQNDIIPKSLTDRICNEFSINNYDFIKFTDFEIVEFLKNLDCIIDYSRLNDLSEKDIVNLSKFIVEKIKKISDDLKSMKESEIKVSSLTKQYNFLNTKLLSLKDALWIKSGIVEFDIPSEINIQNYKIKKKN